MAYDLKKEEDVKDYLHNIGIEYRFGCYSEKKAESCHLLGDYLEAIKKDFAKAAKVYKATCDEYGFSRSCHAYATYTLLGKGLPKENPEEAFEYFDKSCGLGKSESCCNAGIMAVSNNPKTPNLLNYTKGIALLHKGCTLGNPNACQYLSGFYISGSRDKTIPKDMGMAAKYATLGCDMNEIPSCVNLSIMYRKGDGVEKNENKAEELKKKALELQQQHNDTLLVNFQRGPDT